MISAPSQTSPSWGVRRYSISSFTLIELLVVISIIALLIAILLPSLAGARETAKRTVCANNLRQLGQAFFHYANDFDGWYPAKAKFGDPSASIADLATVQNLASPEWGPNFAGLIRDVVE